MQNADKMVIFLENAFLQQKFRGFVDEKNPTLFKQLWKISQCDIKYD